MSRHKDGDAPAVEYMVVVATDMGFYGGARRRKGEHFSVPVGLKASWWKRAGEADEEPSVEQSGDAQPQTLSQIAKTKPKGPVGN